MTQKPDGGPAFPRAASDANGATIGMSLRDYFAGQALAGSSVDNWNNNKLGAARCYAIADAMIAERDAK